MEPRPNFTVLEAPKNPSPARSTKPSKRKPSGASSPALPQRNNLLSRKVTALERLGVEPEDLALAPQITDILSKCFGNGKGSVPRETLRNFLAASPSPQAEAWLACYRDIPIGDREKLSIEAICLKAGVSPLEILGAVLMSAKNLKAQESALKAIMAHPDVVQTTIDSAKDVKTGYMDRKLLHEAVGFLPTRQGSNIAINLLGGYGAPKGEADEPDDDDTAFEEAFPVLSGKLEDWGDARRKLTDGR